jgi:hypothetical protein
MTVCVRALIMRMGTQLALSVAQSFQSFDFSNLFRSVVSG